MLVRYPKGCPRQPIPCFLAIQVCHDQSIVLRELEPSQWLAFGPEADIGSRRHIWNVTDNNCVAVAGVGSCSSLAAYFVD